MQKKKSISPFYWTWSRIYILSRHVVCNVMKIINPIQPLVLQADIMYSIYRLLATYINVPTRMNTRYKFFFCMNKLQDLCTNLQYCLNTHHFFAFGFSDLHDGVKIIWRKVRHVIEILYCIYFTCCCML